MAEDDAIIFVQYVICPRGGVCEYMHARAIYNVLAQGRTVQKGGSNPQPLANHTLSLLQHSAAKLQLMPTTAQKDYLNGKRKAGKAVIL